MARPNCFWFYLTFSITKLCQGACIRVRQSAALLHNMQRALYAPLWQRWGCIEDCAKNAFENKCTLVEALVGAFETRSYNLTLQLQSDVLGFSY